MRILLLGKWGQLGWELQRSLPSLGELTAVDYPEVDLVSSESIRAVVRQVRPQVIINATAYTDVDRAETEPDKALAINAAGPGLLALEAERTGAGLIHYSTDYVFDGQLGRPYLESDAPNPLGIYGQSKLEGEKMIQESCGRYFIFRTSWLYSLRRPSFVTKVLAWSRSQRELKMVTDQVSNPTWSRMLAEVTAQVLAMGQADPTRWMSEKHGLYHVTGAGFTSRMDWARMILANDPKREEQTVEDLQPALTADFPTPAQRPLFSALAGEAFERAFHLTLPKWEESLKLAME